MKNFKQRTFNVCIAYLNHPCCKTKRNLIRCLTKWTMDSCYLDDYGYNGDVNVNIFYCSDRMNMGRAKAILRQINQK